MKQLLKLLLVGAVTLNVFALSKTNFYPKALLNLSKYFSHHVLVVEKSTHTLYLYESDENSMPKLKGHYQIATGKKAGDKVFQGDHRTPEGIYHFTEFLDHAQLLKRHGEAGEIYGVGAFVMNYPNPIDQYNGKTGGGIWLHSTNDETRIDKGLDSRGCIVAHNQNLIKISDFIELDKTNIIVVQNLDFLTETAWTSEKVKIKETIDGWLTAWKSEDFENYISYYSPKEFRDPSRGAYSGFKSYKKAVFSNPGTPQIKASEFTILQTSDYTIVTFIQDYSSNSIQDTGKKILYLKKDEFYNWKIVAESWSKIIDPPTDALAFEPSQRFFSSHDPKQIFTKVLNLVVNPEHSKN